MEMLISLGEEKVKNIITNFSCPLNRDAECFLKHYSIEFAKNINHGIAVTYLIFAYYNQEYILAGYYTLTPKIIMIARKSLSKNYRKRLSKFTEFNDGLNRYLLFAPQIVQLAKNYYNISNILITGDE